MHFSYFPPDDSSKDSSSSDHDSSVPPAELLEGGAQAVELSQGDSSALSAFVFLVGQVDSAFVGAPDCGSSDGVEVDPLIGLLLQSPDTLLCDGTVMPGSAAGV